MERILYKQAVGSLMYAMVATWVDLVYVVSVINQHMFKFGIMH